MTDEKKEPFLLLTKDVGAPPRVGPTMATICERLGRIDELASKTADVAYQTLKRQQQTALMLDGFASTLHRRMDVLHEETALLRVSVSRPRGDADIPVTVEEAEPCPETLGQRAYKAGAWATKGASYVTSAAVCLRLVGKVFPEYEAGIDWLLGLLHL